MKSSLKQTIFAMATAALSVTAACNKDSGPTANESGAETEKAAIDAEAAEGSCGEGKCGEGNCGGEAGKEDSD